MRRRTTHLRHVATVQADPRLKLPGCNFQLDERHDERLRGTCRHHGDAFTGRLLYRVPGVVDKQSACLACVGFPLHRLVLGAWTQRELQAVKAS